MEKIGIICEYNPFHNGHLYHLKKIKEMYKDSLIILVLNGYFLERGEISIINKEDKVKLSLEYGIDLIIELPFVFGTQSADTFAYNSVKILENLKCDYLVFGSESNNVDMLTKIVDYTIKNKDTYNEEIKKYLDEGINYPTALSKALNIDFELNSNDLLGISYIKAIKENNYNIKPITIKRTNNYLDTLSNEDIISASNIRNKIKNNEDIIKYVPNTKYIKNINYELLFSLIKYKIITEHNLSIYLDVDEGIDNKLKKIINKVNNIDELLEELKSKRYTYNKLRRMLIHILIGLTKEDNKKLKLEYIKVLGFNNNGKKYLNDVKKNINIPINIDKNSLTYEYELTSSKIYDIITNDITQKYEQSSKPTQIK